MIYPFKLPKVVYAGYGALEKLTDEILQNKAQKVLLITDAGVQKAGIDKVILSIIEKSGITVDVFSEVEPEPCTETVDRVAKLVLENGYDFLIGVGGGSPMDVTKASAVVATNGGSIRDYVGTELISKPGIPTVLIPTTAGTGAEVTQNAIFAFKDEQVKKGIVSQYLLPQIAIIDPALTMTCPPGITAATGIDALVHAVESFTSLKATPHTDIYALKAIELISQSLRKAVWNGADQKSRENMALGALFAGVSLGNAGVGAVHALAYPLGGKFHVSHGVSNALLFAPVLEFNYVSNLTKFAQIAKAMGEPVIHLSEREAAASCVEAIKTLVQDVGIPQTLKEVGVTANDIDFLVSSAEKQTRLLQNNPRSLLKKDIEAIYNQAL